MPLFTEEAIVLTRYPFREHSAVVVFLCQHRGVIRAVARQARGRRGGGLALEPLARVKVTLFVSPRRELATVNEVQLEHSCLKLAQRPKAWAAALVTAELALELYPPGTSQEAFYRLVEKTISWLEAGEDPGRAVAYALVWSLKLAGVLPGVESCARCGKQFQEEPVVLVPEVGMCCAHHGERGPLLSLTSRGFLGEALKKPLPEISSTPGAELVPALNGLVESFLEKYLRSLVVFREIAGESQPC